MCACENLCTFLSVCLFKGVKSFGVIYGMCVSEFRCRKIMRFVYLCVCDCMINALVCVSLCVCVSLFMCEIVCVLHPGQICDSVCVCECAFVCVSECVSA